MRLPRSRPGLAIATVLAVAGIPLTASAQAWVAPKGEGSVTVAVQSQNIERHLAGTTPTRAGGAVDTAVFLVDTTFGVTDRISVDLAAPYVMSKYSGPVPHPGSNVDDGRYHGTLADLRFAVRFNVTRKGVMFTPYVGTITPSHDYVFFAHAAPSARLKEFQIGAYAAKLFESGIPGLFVSGRYSYGFVEKVLDISHDRSSADLEVGYFISPALRVFGMTSGQYTHGGIDFPTGGMPALAPAYRPVHDQIQMVHFVKVGAGLSYALNDSIDVFGTFARQVTGRNGHELNRGITVGASWGFSLKRKQPPVDVAAAAAQTPRDVSARRQGSLVRCICQKS